MTPEELNAIESNIVCDDDDCEVASFARRIVPKLVAEVRRLQAAQVVCEAAENIYGITDAVCICSALGRMAPCHSCTSGLLDTKKALDVWRKTKEDKLSGR